MKNKDKNENYLDRIPKRNDAIFWTHDDEKIVTLEIENTGTLNRIFQKLLKKPRVTYIHLDELGSFVWPLIDGKSTITELGVLVEEHFGEKAQPVYPRLAKYFEILSSYNFVVFENNK